MNNSYFHLWQNAFNDMFDSASQLKKMDELFEQSLSGFEEFSSMFQKMGNWKTFFNPMGMQLFDFRQLFEEYFKTMGMVSLDEYSSLVKKYEELKKKNQGVNKSQTDQTKKISELNQALKNEKKKIAARDKTISNNKSQINELKKSADALKKDLENTQNRSIELKKKLDGANNQIETMKKELSAKKTAASPKKTTA